MKLWTFSEKILISNNLPNSIIKISNIGDHLYFLTAANKLYHGIVEMEDEHPLSIELHLVEKLNLVDIDACRGSLYVVNTEGNVYRCNEKLDVINEINLLEEYTCCRGHNGTKCKMKVKNISVGDYGQLFITYEGQLWASGYMTQIGINSDFPKRVMFFIGRNVRNVSVGNDFAVVVVSKQNQNNDGDSDEEDVFVTNCPQCLSASHLTSPASQTSISDICPLGAKIQGSYDIETTSTSSKNDTSISSSEIKEGNERNNKDKPDTNKVEQKNIIFRNTEAAKEFLSRQISRMSSAGEEYLVECTEKPTRIIKENMTNVASFVYEGVKTVGDKVVTLSRHVSGSSDCNSVIDNFDELQIPASHSKEDIASSVSLCTSEKDANEQELEEKINSILKVGSTLLNCEVWTWGNIIHGPIGIGDIKKERPMIITKLSNIGVIKTSIQTYHSSALTLDGRAYLWGQNDHNQVTLENHLDQNSPKLYHIDKNDRVKDVICGSHSTSILTNTNELYYLGKGSNKQLTLYSSDKNFENIPISLYNNLVSSSHYILLNTERNSDSSTRTFLAQQQKFLEEMIVVQQNFIKPLQKKNVNSPNVSLYEMLCQNYTDLLYFVAANTESLLEYDNNLIELNNVLLFKSYKELLSLYKNYVMTIQHMISIDGFQNISKLIELSPNLHKIYSETNVKKDKSSDEQIISTLLLSPINQLQNYLSFLKNCSLENSNDILKKWNEFNSDLETKRKEAEATKLFWMNSGKNIDFLKNFERRLIRESHQYPIFLQNASRFSSHWFILFSDLFAHINGSNSYIYNLTTIWIEPVQDEHLHHFQIVLKMPEDNLVLFTTSPESKIDWFHTMQQAIKIALNKNDALQPPSIRTGSYMFTKNGFLKDARYTGRWLNAKMHGSGKLEWPDGKVYTGQVSNNQINGYGVMEIPNFGIYEGYWKENQYNGFGVLTYSNTDVYKGYFKDGSPHGHGFLRQGNFMANAASFYIGDWNSGLKCGYGVMDDIVNGEKYIGNWIDNKKQGNGLIVTADGSYYEGIFNQDNLTGQGIMILEDGTHYEGEFRGTGILSGKGILTLPSGHILDGHLSGSWIDGIKISAGVFSVNSDKKLPSSFGDLCTPVNQKWTSLFKHCHQVLGIPENSSSKNGAKFNDTQTVWQNVAVYLSNAATLKRSKSEKKFQNCLNNLDIIPPFGREKLDFETFVEVKMYLAKAFESNFHPLGLLLNDLTEAYTTTYGGKAHPLLLTHAINELIYVTKRLFEIIRFLFPALPAYEKECLVVKDDSEEIVSWQSLLYPIILPKVYHPLFTLFSLRNEVQERQYKRTLMEWNKLSDCNLMAFLSVDQKFFRNNQLDLKSPAKNQSFLLAIDTLQQLKSTFSPIEKLLVIRQTVEKMTPVAQDMLGENFIWNMDDLFPIFLYVVVRARIPDLGSELDFVDNFMDPSLESGELGIMFTTLKACYQQILQERTSSF